ncbi:hypothetical protein ABZ907_47090 [Nonomuraea wenchangensis]
MVAAASKSPPPGRSLLHQEPVLEVGRMRVAAGPAVAAATIPAARPNNRELLGLRTAMVTTTYETRRSVLT